jgi:hypothetical protein
MVMKHVLQSFWWFFGRIIKAREVLQIAQGTGAILDNFLPLEIRKLLVQNNFGVTKVSRLLFEQTYHFARDRR